jgi:hypothetical protein
VDDCPNNIRHCWWWFILLLWFLAMDDGLDDGFASCRFLVRGVEEENRDAADAADDDNDTAALDEASVMYGGMVGKYSSNKRMPQLVYK